MANEWYYSKNGTKHGPVAGTELKALAEAGKLLPTDLVWKEGMSEWKAASSVKGLLPAGAATAPPPPPSPVAPAAKGLLGAAAATAKRVAAKATDTAKDVQAKAQDHLAKAVDGASQPDGDAPTPRIPAGTIRLSGRGMIGLLLVGGAIGIGIVAAIFVGLIWLGSLLFGGSSSTYANLDAMAKDFEAVYLIEPRHLVTKHRNGIGPDNTSMLIFKGGRNGIKQIAVGTKGNTTVKLFIVEDDGRLVELTKDTLFDTETSAFKVDAAVEYKLRNGVVSGPWRSKWSVFPQHGGTTTTDEFSFKLSDQKRYGDRTP
ncbi:MAG: DUF4339 domain-containing protein [Gemmataceae bacterium]|jgi:hypothetical protein|nr:DUF4339 domain-containing protein [Gemmataceae bacterium]